MIEPIGRKERIVFVLQQPDGSYFESVMNKGVEVWGFNAKKAFQYKSIDTAKISRDILNNKAGKNKCDIATFNTNDL